jgi:hypothetical protein
MTHGHDTLCHVSGRLTGRLLHLRRRQLAEGLEIGSEHFGVCCKVC